MRFRLWLLPFLGYSSLCRSLLYYSTLSSLSHPGGSPSVLSPVRFHGTLGASSLRSCFFSGYAWAFFFFNCSSSCLLSSVSFLSTFVCFLFWLSLSSRSSCPSCLSSTGFSGCTWVGCPFVFWGSPFPPLSFHSFRVCYLTARCRLPV